MPISIFPNPTQVVSGDVSVTSGPADLPVKVDGSGVTQPVTVVADATQPVPVTGNVVVDILAVGGIPIPAGIGVPVTVVGSGLNATVLQGTIPWIENITQFGGNPVLTGTGPSGVGVPRVTVSSDSSVSAVVADGADATLGSRADPAAYTVATSSLLAQIKGLNDTHQTLVQLAGQQLQMLEALLQAINSVAGQLGAVPASVNSAASTPLN